MVDEFAFVVERKAVRVVLIVREGDVERERGPDVEIERVFAFSKKPGRLRGDHKGNDSLRA